MADQLEREKCFKDRYLETTLKKKKKKQGLHTFKMLQYCFKRKNFFKYVLNLKSIIRNIKSY